MAIVLRTASGRCASAGSTGTALEPLHGCVVFLIGSAGSDSSLKCLHPLPRCHAGRHDWRNPTAY